MLAISRADRRGFVTLHGALRRQPLTRWHSTARCAAVSPTSCTLWP